MATESSGFRSRGGLETLNKKSCHLDNDSKT